MYSVTGGCITCRRTSTRPRPQMLGQLPPERLTPSPVFKNVGVDYAGPVCIKYSFIRKPTTVKAYVCVFVALSVKAVHLELVSELSRRPSSPHLVDLSPIAVDRLPFGAIMVLTLLVLLVKSRNSFNSWRNKGYKQGAISEFCSAQNIEWKLIPERAPHFGSLWEAAVKSMKFHLKRVIANTKFTFKEFTTILTQVEACLNSRPLTPMSCDSHGVEALTPGRFLIRKSMELLPDTSLSYRALPLLRRWHLCKSVVRHFWQPSMSHIFDIWPSGNTRPGTFRMEMFSLYRRTILSLPNGPSLESSTFMPARTNWYMSLL